MGFICTKQTKSIPAEREIGMIPPFAVCVGYSIAPSHPITTVNLFMYFFSIQPFNGRNLVSVCECNIVDYEN